MAMPGGIRCGSRNGPPAPATSPRLASGDDRLVRRGDRDAGQSAALDHRDVAGQERLEVHPGAEGAARAGQHAHAQPGIGVELVQCRRNPPGERPVRGVARLRPVHRDHQDRLVAFDQHLVGHAALPQM
jgi:hypothetical protein